jgi:hypothetical protein
MHELFSFDTALFFSTPHRQFTCVHLPRAHLTRLARLFLNAHDHNSLLQPLKVVFNQHLIADCEGPTLIVNAALLIASFLISIRDTLMPELRAA